MKAFMILLVWYATICAAVIITGAAVIRADSYITRMLFSAAIILIHWWSSLTYHKYIVQKGIEVHECQTKQ
jgi:hypothetical protein